jgi:serine/threonine protein kinase
MQCSSCNHDNEAGRNFCAECGKPLPVACPACGVRNQPSVKFCGSCGAALSTFGWSVPAASAQKSSANALPDSFVDGRYKVVGRLGEGSSKTVFLAHDNKIDRDVAFALIKIEGLDASGRERISREARAMGKLGDNPYVVSIYDVGEERGQPFIVSQFMAGGSVDDLLRRSENHRILSADAMRVACDVCRALDYAHSRGIIHRDLKPANVWLTSDGTTKLGDFGLAIASDRSRLTAAGMIVGTAAYMPPEQALGKPLDARSDLYSLGAMLYEMVAGQPPFRGNDLLSVVAQHINAEPEAPSRVVTGIPPELDALILKLLAKSPDQRPRDAAAVRSLLEAMITPAASPIDDVAASVVMERPNLQAHAAPDGTVSILFSDIENSTMMTERLGDLRAQQVLHDHNDMVRKQVVQHKGFEVKSMGDGFMVAFSSARRALLCAIGIQRAVTDYSREHPTQPIRVRIGLHTGEAISEGGDFFGKSVILAARIAAKAHAGEILVSAVFKAVTESAGDLQFDEGYDVELKGLSGSYRVHRALWSNEAGGGAAHSSEPARATLMGASRKTAESAAPVSNKRGRRLLIAAVVGTILLVRGFFDHRPMRESHQTETASEVQPEEEQPVPATAAKQLAAAPAPAPPLTATYPPSVEVPQVAINAPGMSVEQREKALKTVANWLNLLDQGRYWRAWDQSTFLVPREQWAQNQQRLHNRRGIAISRKLESEELSPAPNGNPHRMLFRYQTQFEKGKTVTESVYAIPKSNGQWAVTGYFVKFDADTTASP